MVAPAPATSATSATAPPPRPPPTIAITGGGIVGLTLALALKKHVGITADIYEQATEYRNDVGAGMSLYPNGLRVLNDLNLSFPQAVPYACRRWERHDGTIVAVADEKATTLGPRNGDSGDGDGDGIMPLSLLLQPRGLRRCYLQQVLYQAVREAGIPIHFNKKTVHVEYMRQCLSSPSSNDDDDTDDENKNRNHAVNLVFADGTSCCTDLLFAADGAQSICRRLFAPPEVKYQYTGVTCLMGLANVPTGAAAAVDPGSICFPASDQHHSHGVFFPTAANETCFQIHAPVPAAQADAGNWGTLTQSVGKRECAQLAEELQRQGWHEKFLFPLRHVTHAVRIGLCLLDEPGLEHFVYCNDRVVLLGDAAHPPLPYIGQGAQLGLEDCGVLALLLKRFCLDDNHGVFSIQNLHPALELYEKMRIPRTREIRANCKRFGKRQEIRSTSNTYRRYQQDETIQREVFFHDTLPLLLPGVEYDYQDEVDEALKEYNKACSLLLPVPIVVEEEGAEEDVVEENGKEEEEEAETKI